MNTNPMLVSALAEIIPRLRDVSLRDGIQSWDSNKWPIADVVSVMTQLNILAKECEEHLGVKMAPIEAWGGGQVAQPALFLSENPFENLRQLKEAASHLTLQCLYRGRQAFGFKPVSDEIQKEAIHAAIKDGVRVFRVFDMMNDIENVKTGICILKDYQKSHPHAGVIIEGSLCYITEPDGERAWEFDDYVNYGIEMAKLGVDEIIVKNYAGVGAADMVPMIKITRAALDKNGFKNVKVSFHMHGGKVQTMLDALRAGSDKVDVAIGDLSGGPSHCNMRDVIHGWLKNRFSHDQIDAHPVMQQLEKVEATIHHISYRKPNKKEGMSFYEAREFLQNLSEDQIETYRMAGGAFSDLVARVQKQFPKDIDTQRMFFDQVLAEIPALWERAGRPNTATPGAKILIDQAISVILSRITGQDFTFMNYSQEYLDIITGRYGKNNGIEKKICDPSFCEAVMIFRALKILNEATESEEISKNLLHRIINKAHLGLPGRRVKWDNGVINLHDPDLEAILHLNHPSLKMAALQRFVDAIKHIIDIPAELRKRLLAELSPYRSAVPTDGLEAGQKIIRQITLEFAALEKYELHSIYAINENKELALLAMLLKDKDAFGHDNHSIIRKLIENILKTGKAPGRSPN